MQRSVWLGFSWILYTCTTLGAPVSLVETLKIATERSPSLINARREVTIRDRKASQARARFLPALDLSTRHGIEKINPASAPDPWSSRLALGITENLYDNHQSLTGLELARVNQEIAQLSFLKAREKLALDVATAFYQLSRDTRLLEVQAQQVLSLEKQFQLIEVQFKQGFKKRQDYLRLKAELHRSQFSLTEVASAIRSDKSNLSKLLGGGENPIEYEILPMSPLATPSTAPAKTKNLVFRSSSFQRRSNALTTTLEERKNGPELNLTAGLNYSNADYLGSSDNFSKNQRYGWNVLLTLNYNLWDWGIRENERAIARSRQAVEDSLLDETLLSTESEMRTLMATLAELGSNHKLSEDLLKLEEESHKAIRSDYQDGRVSYLDFIKSLNDLLDARRKVTSTYFALVEGIAKHQHFEGILYETIVK